MSQLLGMDFRGELLTMDEKRKMKKGKRKKTEKLEKLEILGRPKSGK